MSSVDVQDPVALPQELMQPLRQLRKLIHGYVLTEGAVHAVLFALILFWLFGLCDYLPIQLGASESPKVARSVMLGIWVAGTLYILFRLGFAKRWVHWSEDTLSLLIERRFPSLESSLSTVIHGAKRPNKQVDGDEIQKMNRAMLAGSMDLALERMKDVQVEEVMNWRPLRWKIALLSGIAVVSLTVAFLQPQWVGHWSKRFFGLSEDPWPRSVRLQIEGMELDVPSFTGELDRPRYMRSFRNMEATIIRGKGGVLHVLADRNAERVPEYCSIHYRSEDGTGGRANLRRLPNASNDWESFVLEGPPLESIDQSIQFAVSAGDMKLPRHTIRLVESPIVARTQLALEYPAYLRSSTNGSYLPETIEYRNGQRLPQGTGVRLLATASKKLNRVDYIVSTGKTLPEERKVQSIELDSETFAIPICNPNEVTESMVVELRLWDADGLCADRIQQYVITVVPDEIPRLDLVLDGIGSAVTPKANIPLKAVAKDDYGLQSHWLEIVSNESAPYRAEVKADNEGKIVQEIGLTELQEKWGHAIEVNTTLALTAAAQDHFNLEGKTHVGRASPIQLAVVTPESLLIILAKRELAMRSRIDQIISEMTQMRELIRRNRESTTENAEPTEGASDGSGNPDPAEQVARMRVLRAQQSSMQATKSDGELKGVAREIHQITRELVNNKVDSKDRQDRLEAKVYRPIVAISEGPFVTLLSQLKEIEKSIGDGQTQFDAITGAMNTTDDILVKLNEVLSNMIDIQDFNELIDMVRTLMEDQQQLLDATKKEQKKQVLDLFK